MEKMCTSRIYERRIKWGENMNYEKGHERFLNTILEIANQIIKNSKTINTTHVLKLIDLITQVNSNDGTIFVYGAGRSGFIGRCFAQRLMHLGVNSCFVSDAITHRYSKEDLLILISGSGETTSPVAIARKAKDIGGKIALLTNNPESTIGKISNVIIKIEGKSKDIAVSQKTLAPYTTLFDISTLTVLDSIGATLMELLGVTEKDIDKRHASIE
ncbi:3-hexulose-6-phosphate isomerase [subsurface metagenome]